MKKFMGIVKYSSSNDQVMPNHSINTRIGTRKVQIFEKHWERCVWWIISITEMDALSNSCGLSFNFKFMRNIRYRVDIFSLIPWNWNNSFSFTLWIKYFRVSIQKILILCRMCLLSTNDSSLLWNKRRKKEFLWNF